MLELKESEYSCQLSSFFCWHLWLHSVFFRIVNLQVSSSNIAIPTFLIGQEDAQLNFTFYVQIIENYLTYEDLLNAVQVDSDRQCVSLCSAHI